MDKLTTISDLSTTGSLALMQSLALAMPSFFPILLFMIWIFGTAASYFVMLKTTGRKRFWNALTAMSFGTFILSILLTAMNTTVVTILDGYWVAFFILTTLFSWWGLNQYK